MNIIFSGFIHPFVGILSGLLLVFGTEFIGRLLLKKFKYSFFFLNLSFGFILISQVTYISLLLSLYQYLSWIISYSAICFGVYEIIFLLKKKNINIKFNYYFFFIFIYLFFLFVISISAPTMADALDYHLGVANYINNFNELPNPYAWPSSALFGLGEVFNSLGLKVYSDIAGSLLQFIALISFLFYFRKIISKNFKYLIFCLFILGSPVVIFFVSGAKHQILPQLITTLILYLLVTNKVFNLKFLFLITFLLCGVANIKLNFILTGFVLFLLLAFKSSINFKFIFICFLNFVIFFLFKATYNYFELIDFSFINFFTIASKDFLDNLSRYAESGLIFPLGLFLPSSVGNITTILGFQIFILFLIKKFNYNNIRAIIEILIIIIVSSVLLFFFTQKIGRIFYEIILYSSLFIVFIDKYRIRVRNINNLLLLNLCLPLLISFCGFLILSSSLISNANRNKVMRSNASEYKGAEWVNENISFKDTILTDMRSLSLLNAKSIVLYDLKNNKNYLNYVKNINIDYIVVKNVNDNKFYFQNCNLIFLKKSPNFFKETRNIFNRNENYNIYIFKLKSRSLGKC